jgi:hypothetical protein
VASQNSSTSQTLTIGSAFVNQNPGSPEHLWIVVAVTKDGDAVIFNITTVRQGCDMTCPVTDRDHPFVRHDSVVAYGRGQLISPGIFAALQHAGCSMERTASPELVNRIREGAMKSRFTPQKLQIAIASIVS